MVGWCCKPWLAEDEPQVVPVKYSTNEAVAKAQKAHDWKSVEAIERAEDVLKDENLKRKREVIENQRDRADSVFIDESEFPKLRGEKSLHHHEGYVAQIHKN